jgi:hypothetical protein
MFKKRVLAGVCGWLGVWFLAGCGSSLVTAPSLAGGVSIRGNVHGGQAPVSGSHVHLMAVSPAGNGTASVSLLTTGIDGTDSIGGYVLTGADGGFSITGDYTCTPDQYVYALATEGNPGVPGDVNNTGIGEMAVIGACIPNPAYFIQIDEVTTVTSANAFATDGNLETNGVALAATPAGNGVAPQAEINTLADILAACINSTSSTSTSCALLFDNALANGSSGATPTNTAQAIFNIAGNPATVNVATLMTIPTATSPYQPSLGTTVPPDFTVQIQYTGYGLSNPYVPSVDKYGDVWVPNDGGNLVELSPVGAPLSGASGFSNSGSTMLGTGSVVDLLGNVWVTNGRATEKFSATGTHLLTASGGNPGTTYFNRLTSDASSNIWVAADPSALGKYANDGTPLTPSGGVNTGTYNEQVTVDSTGTVWALDKGGYLDQLTSDGTLVTSYADEGYGAADPVCLATDGGNNTWLANYNDSTLGRMTPGGSLTLYSGGGLSGPYWVTLDGAGTAWVMNLGNNSVSAFTNGGVAVTPAAGGYAIPNEDAGFALGAVDGSGNLWVSEPSARTVTEIVGVAVPVVTPINPGSLAVRP